MKHKGFAGVLLIIALAIIAVTAILFYIQKQAGKLPLPTTIQQPTFKIAPPQDVTIAFMRDGDIWLLDKGEEKKLTKTDGKVKEFTWGKNTKDIIYVLLKHINISSNWSGILGSEADIGTDVISINLDNLQETPVAPSVFSDEKLQEAIAPAGCCVFVNETKSLIVTERFVYFIRNGIFRVDLYSGKISSINIESPKKEKNEYLFQIRVSPDDEWLIYTVSGHEFGFNKVKNMITGQQYDLGYDARLGATEPLKIIEDFLDDGVLLRLENPDDLLDPKIEVFDLQDKKERMLIASKKFGFISDFCQDKKTLYFLYYLRDPKLIKYNDLEVISLEVGESFKEKSLFKLQEIVQRNKQLSRESFVYGLSTSPDCKYAILSIKDRDFSGTDTVNEVWLVNLDNGKQQKLLDNAKNPLFAP